MRPLRGRSWGIFAGTSIAAFWVNALGHLLLLSRGDPLVRQYKATLEYRSALIGDSILLPLVNVLLDQQLEEWGDGLPKAGGRRGRLLRAILAGSGITALFHLYQGANRLTNWTMPRPWRWNGLGYYHALYMATQFSVLSYFCGAAATQARDRGYASVLTKRLALVGGLLSAFAALLYKDYY